MRVSDGGEHAKILNLRLKGTNLAHFFEVHVKGLSNVFSKNERRPLTAVLFRSAGLRRTSTETAVPSILQRVLADISIPKNLAPLSNSPTCYPIEIAFWRS